MITNFLQHSHNSLFLLTYSHLSHFMKFNKRKEKRRKGAQGLYQVQRLNGQHLDGEGVIAEEIIC